MLAPATLLNSNTKIQFINTILLPSAACNCFNSPYSRRFAAVPPYLVRTPIYHIIYNIGL